MKKNNLTLKIFLAFLVTAAMIVTYMPCCFVAYAAGEAGQAAVEEQTEQAAESEVQAEPAAETADISSIITPDKHSSHRTGTLVWQLGVILAELVILGILSALIVSDLRVIRWYEKKRRP